MRIISGIYKGLELNGYDIDGTRPTQDRIKESLFSMIQSDLRDAVVLDLFSGTGNLGLESLSNGSSFAYFVDNNEKCIQAIKKNLKKVPQEQVEILNCSYLNALKYFKEKKQKLDVVFLDPPYHLDCIDSIIKFLIDEKLLNEEAIIVCEYEQEQFSDSYDGLELWKEKEYGYKKIKIYRS